MTLLPATRCSRSSRCAGSPHQQQRTAESLTETIGTHSHTIVVEAAERLETLTRVREFLDAQPETGHGSFARPLVSYVARSRPL